MGHVVGRHSHCIFVVTISGRCFTCSDLSDPQSSSCSCSSCFSDLLISATSSLSFLAEIALVKLNISSDIELSICLMSSCNPRNTSLTSCLSFTVRSLVRGRRPKKLESGSHPVSYHTTTHKEVHFLLGRRGKAISHIGSCRDCLGLKDVR